MLERLLRRLLPGACLLCDAPLPSTADVDLCRYCLDALPWNRGACPRCAEPVPEGAPRGSWCAACTRDPPPFRAAIAPLCYEGFAQLWVRRLKDHLGMVEGRILGTLLAGAADAAYRADPGLPRPDLLVPVPLTLGRLARRGHNQALALARPVAARLGIPISRTAVMRRRRSRPQRGLGRAARLGNLEGSFAARRTWPEPGPCVGIVDDVITTGATAAALTRTLLAAGAREVHVLCAARTPRRR
ncbi:MAG TPA: double zinc ribbon domain-containing protein [Pseudomonadales bacterium]